MTAAPAPSLERPNTQYLMLRTALDQYGREPAGLSQDELAEVTRVVDRYGVIEERVLATPLAAVAEARVQPLPALEQYLTDEPLELQPLLDQGMELSDLAVAIRRDQWVQRTLELVAEEAPGPTEQNLRDYYESHPEQFRRA